MLYSLSSLKKLTRELAKILLDNQHKFDNSLDSINVELLELKTKFTKMESVLATSKKVNVNLVECLVVAERKCWVSEQYLKRKCLKVLEISDLVSDNALEDKIQGVLRGIDVEVGRENMESCHRLKGKRNKGKFILKLSKRKYTDKIKLSKKTLKNIDQKEKNELLSGTKVFKNESLCGHYRLLWSRCVKKYFWKKNFCIALGYKWSSKNKIIKRSSSFYYS